MVVDIYHNILWSRYKAKVFSELMKLSNNSLIFNIIHISATEGNRTQLSKVNYSIHDYKYTLFFDKNIDSVSLFELIKKCIIFSWKSNSNLIILSGYYKIEYWIILIISRLRGKKIAIFVDSTLNDNKQYFFKKIFKILFLKSCISYFCYGERSREYLLSLGIKDKNIFTRCQAAALPSDYCTTNILDKRNKLTKGISFLYVGRLSPEKNLTLLIMAFNLFLKNYPDAQLVIIGDGSEKLKLLSYVTTIGLLDKVIFTGGKNEEELQDFYLSANCLVLPSLSEPWGLVVNEALSYGCPVIVSNKCGCVPELVIEGYTGYSFNPNDCNELVSRMIDILELSNSKNITDNCFQVIAEFTPSKAANQIYNGCLTTLLN